jgi:hypothetical protein
MEDSGDKGRAAPQDVTDELEQLLDQYLVGSEGIDRARAEEVVGLVQEKLAEHGGGYGEIDTWSGEKVAPLDPDPESIKLDDTAHGLSNLGRFAGQGATAYSVARHSVHVSREVEARGGTIEAQRWGLLHDGAEAYLSDVPGPVKRGLPGYKHAERRLDEVVRVSLGLEPTDTDVSLVHEADEAVGDHELSKQFPHGGHVGADLKHHPSPADTDRTDKELFRRRARELGLLDSQELL